MIKRLALFLFLLACTVKAQNELSLASIKEIIVPSSEMGCGLLTYPGDIILQHEETFHEHRLGDNIILAAKIKEILSFKKPEVKFGHAEIITNIAKDPLHLSLVSWSFYPPRFQEHLPEEDRKGPFIQFGYGDSPMYRMNYSVYRVKRTLLSTTTDLREEALSNIKYRSKDSVYGYRLQPQQNNQSEGSSAMEWQKVEFSQWMNVCSDFVAWAYSKNISSWWNRIPIAKQLIATVYPFEAMTTPDDLASSPDTVKLCEVNNLDLKLPESGIDTKKTLAMLIESLKSKNEEIVKHAEWVKARLVKAGIITPEFEPLFDRFSIKVQTDY